MAHTSRIFVGMGGWSYKPWRETFYPPEVKVKDELSYASRQVTAIEINSTFYGLQKPAVFAKWRDATPEEFKFSLKAPRFTTQRKVLAEAASSIDKFIASGIEELRDKLGPIVWQLAPTHHFEATDLEAFLDLLPEKVNGRRLRHALNVRHASFQDIAFIELAKRHHTAVVFEDDAMHPAIADVTADFVYARLRRSVASETTGYTKSALKKWADRATTWSQGESPKDLPLLADTNDSKKARDVFVYFINGAKERAPAAAGELIEILVTRL
ncbi:MAG TPA: DUF72 domain-containing protein [Steroidobacteraceae bacterium]|nr:DUF72 domain-containing protein [Steroidobacteraceae bacterium]